MAHVTGNLDEGGLWQLSDVMGPSLVSFCLVLLFIVWLAGPGLNSTYSEGENAEKR